MYKLVVNRQCDQLQTTVKYANDSHHSFGQHFILLPIYNRKMLEFREKRRKKNERKKEAAQIPLDFLFFALSRKHPSSERVSRQKRTSNRHHTLAIFLLLFSCACVCICVRSTLNATLLSYPLQWRSPQQSDFDKGLYVRSHSFQIIF